MTIDESSRGDISRGEILARLAQSRQELRQLLEPPEERIYAAATSGAGARGFPRSRTMKWLLSGGGLGLTAVAGGLLVARPALALRLLKMLPSGLKMLPRSAVGRMLMLRALSALRQKRG